MSDFFSQEPDSSNSLKQFYRKKLLTDLQPDDELVQLVGYAMNPNASLEFELVDGSMKIHVRNIPDSIHTIESNHLYRVFGQYSIDPIGTHYIKAEIIQDFGNINFDQYKKALQLTKTIE
jgi:hypothetical protein